MDGTYVKKEPRDDRSSTVLSGLSNKDKDEHRNKPEKKKKRAKGNVSGADDTGDLDTPGSDSDNSNESDSDIEGDSDVYEVEKVVGHRYDHQNTLSYHIKWKGYSDEESTWEHESQVFCVDMVKNYWKQYAEQGGNRSDLQGTITRPTSSTLSLSGRRKSTTSSMKVSGNKHSSSKGGGKAGGGKGGSGGRLGRISPEPLLPDLSPLVKSSAAAAVSAGTMPATTATTTTTSTTGATKHISSKRARTRSPERQSSALQSSQRDTNTFVVPTSTTYNKSSTSSTTTKVAKVASESWSGTIASATGGVATTSEQQQQSKDSAPLRKLTAVGPVLMTEENWTPPSHWGSWDGHVERVEAIETRSADRHDRSTMFVHLRWKNGDRLTLHPLQEIHEKAPRRLIDFYEGHLQFQESE